MPRLLLTRQEPGECGHKNLSNHLLVKKYFTPPSPGSCRVTYIKRPPAYNSSKMSLTIKVINFKSKYSFVSPISICMVTFAPLKFKA
jgi:hypothetical protein